MNYMCVEEISQANKEITLKEGRKFKDQKPIIYLSW